MTLTVRSFPPLLALLLAGALPLPAADDAVDKVSKLAVEWVKTRSETVRLETEWSGQRELTQAMIKATEERARLAEETVEQLKARTAQERSELDAIDGGNEAAEKGFTAASTRLKELSPALLALRPGLPPRLQAALELPYKSLQDPELPASDRLQHVMTILGRCLQFNRVITAGEEVLTLKGEPAPRSVEVIYWGLSHGYALDRPAGKAWVGATGPDGWQWEPHPEAAAEIGRLVAMANDKAEPAFVVVPVKLNHAQH